MEVRLKRVHRGLPWHRVNPPHHQAWHSTVCPSLNVQSCVHVLLIRHAELLGCFESRAAFAGYQHEAEYQHPRALDCAERWWGLRDCRGHAFPTLLQVRTLRLETPHHLACSAASLVLVAQRGAALTARLPVDHAVADRASLFHTRDLLLVHRLTGIPIVFDFHHHKFCNGARPTCACPCS